jgi:hypothetical protein
MGETMAGMALLGATPVFAGRRPVAGERVLAGRRLVTGELVLAGGRLVEGEPVLAVRLAAFERVAVGITGDFFLVASFSLPFSLCALWRARLSS